MSLTGVKDLDYKICLLMDDGTLSAFCKINRYHSDLNVWGRKIALYKIEKYLQKGRKLDEEYYYELKSALQADMVKGVFDAIEKDRLDILALLFIHHDLNPNYLFCFNDKYYSYIQGNKYTSTITNNPNLCFSFLAVSQILARGNYDMWNFLITRHLKPPTSSDDYILAMSGRNLNIIKDLVILYRVPITAHVLMHSLGIGNKEVAILFLDHMEQEEIDALISFMKESWTKEYFTYDWITEDNCAIQVFLNIIDDKKLHSMIRERMRKNSKHIIE